MHNSKKYFAYAEEKQYDPFATVLLVGPSQGGPVGTPFLLYSEDDAKEFLGDSPLYDAYTACAAAKVPDIILYRINGEHAETVVKHPVTGEPMFNLYAICGGEYGNDIRIMLYETHLLIDEVAVDGRRREYDFSRFPNVQELVQAINNDATFGLTGVMAHALSDAKLSFSLPLPVLIQLNNGVSDAWMCENRWDKDWQANDKQLLTDSFINNLFEDDSVHPYLGMLNFNTMVLAGWYMEDDFSFIQKLEDFAQEKSVVSDVGCTIVVGTEPITTVTNESVADKKDALMSVEKGKYPHVQVVVGEGYFEIDGPMISMASAYGALLGTIKHNIIPTNKKLEGILGLNYELSQKYVASLSSNGYICIVPSIRKGYVPFYATIFSSTKETSNKPHIIRTIQYLHYELQIKTSQFIGDPMLRRQKQQLEQFLKEILDEYVKNQWVRSYESSISYKESDTLAVIDLVFQFYGEIERVQSNTTVYIARGNS
ncbi:hypothetical protein_gp104 [Bacillus phage vB_BceM_WH1]|nr:hypothetical protein_gp104 [Bacillus phage vB_BceM_WH1]